ncbi:MAG: hypothetical protein WAV07_02930 [Candidatus Contendobacter sp.]
MNTGAEPLQPLRKREFLFSGLALLAKFPQAVGQDVAVSFRAPTAVLQLGQRDSPDLVNIDQPLHFPFETLHLVVDSDAFVLVASDTS